MGFAEKNNPKSEWKQKRNPAAVEEKQPEAKKGSWFERMMSKWLE